MGLILISRRTLFNRCSNIVSVRSSKVTSSKRRIMDVFIVTEWSHHKSQKIVLGIEKGINDQSLRDVRQKDLIRRY